VAHRYPTPEGGRYTRAMTLTRPLLSIVLALSCASAAAQWQWLDKDGRKVFSDRPPTADVPEKNILKRPGGMTKAAVPDPAPAAAEANAPKTAQTPAMAASVPQAAGSSPKLSGVDKELEQKKKQAADAEAAKRKLEDEKLAKDKAENCNRAKAAKASLESGVRIARVNAKGEREIMDDATRADEAKRVQGIIASSCS
jgi:type IV secretory pathway VirB10-like protein